MTTSQKIKIFLGTYMCVNQSDITDKTTLDSLGADSLDQFEIAFELEDIFDVSVPDDVVANWNTVGDIIKYFEA